MSYTIEPDYNLIIERIAAIIEASALVFPKTVGLDEEATDLLNKVYRFQPPIPENPDSGVGPPHAFVTTPEKVLVYREQTGNDTRDAKGPQRSELEFYIVVVTFNDAEGRTKSESDIYKIISAIKTTIYKNIRLCTPSSGEFDSSTRMCSTLEIFDVPYLLNTEQKSLIARNIVVRPKIDTKFT